MGWQFVAKAFWGWLDADWLGSNLSSRGSVDVHEVHRVVYVQVRRNGTKRAHCLQTPKCRRKCICSYVVFEFMCIMWICWIGEDTFYRESMLCRFVYLLLYINVYNLCEQPQHRLQSIQSFHRLDSLLLVLVLLELILLIWFNNIKRLWAQILSGFICNNALLCIVLPLIAELAIVGDLPFIFVVLSND